MPVAVIVSEYKKFDLRSLPAVGDQEGGFVMLRPLPYGMKLERRDKSTRMRLEQQIQTRKSRRQDEPTTQTFEIESESAWAANYDFAYCIGDHNLQDINGHSLDFSSAMTLKILDPKVGSEIENLLTEINGDDISDDDLEDFTRLHTQSSPDVPTALKADDEVS